MASSSKSSFDTLRLSLDPTTIKLALGEKRVEAIDLDGTFIYEDDETQEAELTAELERIWNEYPSGLLDLTEAKLESLPPNDIAFKAKPEGQEVEKSRDVFKMMEFEEMERLRSEMFMQLNDARNELWFALELAKTLSVSSGYQSQPPPPPVTLHQKKPPKTNPKSTTTTTTAPQPAATSSIPTEPPILPPGTFTTIPSSLLSVPLHSTVNDLIQLIQARDSAVDQSLGLIDGAVEELELMGSAGDSFWHDVRGLREGHAGRGKWAVVPKPDFARTMKDGERAKDVIIPYAIDEASASTRARCIAGFDLDPTIPTLLSFPARSYRRVRVLLKDLSSGTVVSSEVEARDKAGDVREEMERAQMEAFDEDLFSQIRIEASTLDNAIIEPHQIQIQASSHTLIFQLYSPPSAPSPSPTPSQQTPTSPLCTFLLGAARINLLSALRVQKQKLVSISTIAPSSEEREREQEGVVANLLEGIEFKGLWEGVQSAVECLRGAVEGAGVGVEVGWDVGVHAGSGSGSGFGLASGGDGAGALLAILGEVIQGQKLGKDLEVVWTISVCDSTSTSIKIILSPPTSLLITLPYHYGSKDTHPSESTFTFPLTHPEELSGILAEEVERQILGMVERRLGEKSVEERRMGKGDGKGKDKRVWWDKLEGAVKVGDRRLRVSLPPPYHTLYASLSSPAPSQKSEQVPLGKDDVQQNPNGGEAEVKKEEEKYDSRTSEGRLWGWVEGIGL
ncbi:hypothetical protein IAR50_002543 [Cryptococcus sp. DSM 104548]